MCVCGCVTNHILVKFLCVFESFIYLKYICILLLLLRRKITWRGNLHKSAKENRGEWGVFNPNSNRRLVLIDSVGWTILHRLKKTHLLVMLSFREFMVNAGQTEGLETVK